MKVLITGGSGTLGKEIANLVFKKKYEVNILTRNKNLKSHNPQLKYYYWNPKKEDIDLGCFNNVDCVINLAGFSVFSLWTKANKTKIFESRVGSTNFILDVILKKNIKIKSFVNASAIAAYRDSSDFTSSENDSIDNPNSFINQVVVKWENEVKKFESKLPDISFSIMRIGLVLSKSGGLYKICKMLSKLFILSPTGNGNQWQSWIHEKDAAKIILSSCENSWRGTYNFDSILHILYRPPDFDKTCVLGRHHQGPVGLVQGEDVGQPDRVDARRQDRRVGDAVDALTVDEHPG